MQYPISRTHLIITVIGWPQGEPLKGYHGSKCITQALGDDEIHQFQVLKLPKKWEDVSMKGILRGIPFFKPQRDQGMQAFKD